MNARTSNEIADAPEAILAREKVDSFNLETNLQTTESLLMQAWTSESSDEKLEALLQVLDLDPDNQLAQTGLEWVDGMTTLAQQIARAEEGAAGEETALHNNEPEVDHHELEDTIEEAQEAVAEKTSEEKEEGNEAQDRCCDDNIESDSTCCTPVTQLFGFSIDNVTLAEDDEAKATESVEFTSSRSQTAFSIDAEHCEEPVAEDESDGEFAIETKDSEETDADQSPDSYLMETVDEFAAKIEEVVYWAGDTQDTAEAEAIESDDFDARSEAGRLEQMEEEARRFEETEAKRIADEEQAEAQAFEARRLEEAEAQRIAQEQAEAQRIAEEQAAEARRLEEEAEAQRLVEEAEAQRIVEEQAAEARRLEDEAEVQRLIQETEAQRIAEEQAEAQRLNEEAEAQRIAQEQAEAQRIAEEQVEAQRIVRHQAQETVLFEETFAVAPSRQQSKTFVVSTATEQDAEVVEAEIQEGISELVGDVREFVADLAPTDTTPTATDRPLVLAVDDSPTILKLVTMTLSREGFEVIAAADGLEALQILSNKLPDIILSEVNLPRLDGYKLCRFVKKHERTKHIPVVMLSGKDGVFDKLRGKMSGCGDYITKPFESEDLVEKVRFHTGVYTS